LTKGIYPDDMLMAQSKGEVKILADVYIEERGVKLIYEK